MYQIGNCACTKTAHILKVSKLIVFLPVCCLLINCIGIKPFFLVMQMLLPDIRHVSGTEFFVFQLGLPVRFFGDLSGQKYDAKPDN